MFLVDASDPDRLTEAKETFHKTVQEPLLLGKPVLVYACDYSADNCRARGSLTLLARVHTLFDLVGLPTSKTSPVRWKRPRSPRVSTCIR